MKTLNDATAQALAQTALEARAQAFGWSLEGGAPSRLAELARREAETYQDLMATLKIDRQ